MSCDPLSLTATTSAAPPDSPFAGDLQGKSVKELKGLLKEIQNHSDYKQFQKFQACEDYNETFTTGTIIKNVFIIALLITGIVAFVLHKTGHLTSFPQDFMHWIENIDPVNAAIGGAIAIVLIGGASWIIHRAKKEKDPALFDKQRGKFGDVGDYLESGIITYSYKDKQTNSYKKGTEKVYLDRSMIEKKGLERACLYRLKPVCGHYMVSTVVTFLGTPVYLVGVVAFNAIRAVLIPFYILYRMAKELCCGTPSRYKLSDIPVEVERSIVNIVEAPFYALAYFMTSLYSLVDPMPGRKWATTVEWMWNKKASLAISWWSRIGPQKLFEFEGEGSNFYLAGCWHEEGYAEYEYGEFKKAYYMPAAIQTDLQDKIGYTYTLELRSELKQHVEDHKVEIENLLVKEKAIKEAIKGLRQSGFPTVFGWSS